MDNIFEITASTVTLEVKDEKTGQVFKRELPIDYYENANFVRLRAEHMDGSMAEMVFLSARGIERAEELTGKGADHDRHEH